MIPYDIGSKSSDYIKDIKVYKCNGILDRELSKNGRYTEDFIKKLKLRIFEKMCEEGMFETLTSINDFSDGIEIKVKLNVKYPEGYGDPKWEK